MSDISRMHEVCLESPISGMSEIHLVVILGILYTPKSGCCVGNSPSGDSGVLYASMHGMACSGDSGLLHLIHAEHENRGGWPVGILGYCTLNH